MNKEASNKQYLVYCIASTSGTQRPKGLVGVNSAPLSLVSYDGLMAVVSKIKGVDTAPRLSRILAYKEVVEAFHLSNMTGGVIPMRYGCMADDKTQIRSLLRKNCSRYTALLKELAGCVEMGIRILIAECRVPSADSKKFTHQLETRNSKIENRKSKVENRKSKIENPGKAYLTARKMHYRQEETFSKRVEHVIEWCCASFSGLFVKWKAEVPSIGSFRSASGNRQLVSIYFLVPRDSLDQFRAAFRQADTGETTKLLMSGPWPPYTFVQPEHTKTVSG